MRPPASGSIAIVPPLSIGRFVEDQAQRFRSASRLPSRLLRCSEAERENPLRLGYAQIVGDRQDHRVGERAGVEGDPVVGPDRRVHVEGERQDRGAERGDRAGDQPGQLGQFLAAGETQFAESQLAADGAGIDFAVGGKDEQGEIVATS